MNRTAIEFVDLARALRRVDAAYFAPTGGVDPLAMRIHALAFAAADSRLYVVFASAFVFWSDDGAQSWHEVAEVNRRADGELHRSGDQHVDAIVDTVSGTVLLIGRDRHDGSERGVVWRKPQGSESFARTVATDPAWPTGKSGNASAGYIGGPPREIVAVAIYDSPAQFWFSLDDGISWRRQDMGELFAEHVHEVYLHRSANLHRVSRLWVSGGDDLSGERGGVATLDAVNEDGTLGGMRFALRERPGYRLVGLAGDGKHVYFGNESVAGGVLRVLDNAQSIELGDFEYVLGKSRHDYFQFRSMVATSDGLLAAATDSYVAVSDTIRADSGGFLYLSNDGGASFRELSLGMKWITGLVYDGASFWVAGGMNREHGSDASSLRTTLLRIPKPPAFATLSGDYCAKPVMMDASTFYAMAGFRAAPRPSLAPGERTFRVDLAPYGSICVEAETFGPATLVVEALPFQTWHPDEDAWRDVATLSTAAGRIATQLAPLAAHNRWFRVRNAGTAAVELKRVVFVARR